MHARVMCCVCIVWVTWCVFVLPSALALERGVEVEAAGTTLLDTGDLSHRCGAHGVVHGVSAEHRRKCEWVCGGHATGLSCLATGYSAALGDDTHARIVSEGADVGGAGAGSGSSRSGPSVRDIHQHGHTNIGVLILGAGAEQSQLAKSVLSGALPSVTSVVMGDKDRPVTRPPLPECG